MSAASPRPAGPPGKAGPGGGNRLWRVETPSGPLLQKAYRRKSGPVGEAWRGVMSRLLRRATSTSAAARWRTEGEMLAHWRENGVDVPRDRTAEFPHLAGENVRLLEWVEGRPLSRLLARGQLRGEARADLLRRAGAAWGGRLARALRLGDARLVQFHAGFQHLLVAGERTVSIDLEQAYLPGRPVPPVLAREVLSCLHTLRGAGGEEAFEGDLAALVAGIPDRGFLEAVLGRPGFRRPGARGRERDRHLAVLRRVLRGP